MSLGYLAWETILETYRDPVGDPDALPGTIAGMKTFGEWLHFHPHVHTLVTNGDSLPDGTSRQLPHENGTGSNLGDSRAARPSVSEAQQSAICCVRIRPPTPRPRNKPADRRRNRLEKAPKSVPKITKFLTEPQQES